MSWLGSKPFARSKSRVIPVEAMDWSRFDETHRRVSVVGYDFHQPALLAAGGRELGRETDRYETVATLRREPQNSHDKFAVPVLVAGRRIGYLKAGTGK